MTEYLRPWLALWSEQRAVTTLEYALIAGVLVATILIGFNVFASDLSNSFSNIGGSL
jgi:Flp pilus assembly pilin Flp